MVAVFVVCYGERLRDAEVVDCYDGGEEGGESGEVARVEGGEVEGEEGGEVGDLHIGGMGWWRGSEKARNLTVRIETRIGI